MKKLKNSLLAFIFIIGNVLAVSTGDTAPEFSLIDENGKKVSLSQFKGKHVVLEWLNHGCPFVKKHYKSGNMQNLQKEYTKKDVVWLSVISSAPGKQGHRNPAEAKKEKVEMKSLANHVLIDESGAIGKAYGAQTTPHMYIVNPKGKLVYQGAIDDKPSTDVDDVKGAKNWVKLALDESLSGKVVKFAKTNAYGCSVKYK